MYKVARLIISNVFVEDQIEDILFYTTDDKQKGYMGAPVKNILITLLINTSSNLKEKVMRIK